jgi:hypothetical protein
MTAEPEAEVVVGELVPIEQPPPGNLFGSSDPHVFLTRASEAAGALADVIRRQKLAVTIRGREHVRVEGWTCLGSLLGVFPELEWSRPVDGGWEARVVAHTRAGETVGAAESMCTRSEQRWRTADDYAIRSMAATRATSKALRQPLGFVMALAGFDPTPLEEMPADEPAEPKPATTSKAAPVEARPEQVDQIITLIKRLTQIRPDTDWRQKAREITGGGPELMTVSIADVLITRLSEALAAAEQFDADAEEGGF